MESNIETFERVLDPSDNSTGGDTAFCVAGAMAAGLTGMVARLSMGKVEPMPAEPYKRIARPAEQLSRGLAIQKGVLHCSEVPLANARKCREVSNLADQLDEKFNLNAASNLQCAQYLVSAGLGGCVTNVQDRSSRDKGSDAGPKDRSRVDGTTLRKTICLIHGIKTKP